MADVAREDARADCDPEAVAVAQVDVAVVGPDELTGLAGDPFEKLLDVELVDERERRLVQRLELGVPALELVSRGHLRGDVHQEPLGVDRATRFVLGDRHLVVDPHLVLVLADDPVLRGEGLAGPGRVAALFECPLAVVGWSIFPKKAGSLMHSSAE